MTKPRTWGIVVSLTLGLLGCNDSPGTTGDGGRDAPLAPGDGSGWTVYYESGPVQVHDGGKIIVEDGGGKIVCYVTSCAGKTLECGDCIDNDADGKVDWRDPECLGPCDNTEGPALIGGIGGDTGTSCGVDCYFDFGNGPGNDDCFWDHRCDTLEPEKATCAFDQSMVGGKNCPAKQSAQCEKYCIPYTPNGCDCFGCCTFPALGGKYVWIGAFDPQKKAGTCTLADVTNPQKCPPCTPVDACNNPCGPCEVCIGRPVPPPECFAKPPDGGVKVDFGPPPQQCQAGVQPCGLAGQAPCADGYYCISGCCIKVQID